MFFIIFLYLSIFIMIIIYFNFIKNILFNYI